MNVPLIIQLKLSIHGQSCFIYSFVTPRPNILKEIADIISSNQLVWNCPKVKFCLGTSLAVQWLRLQASTAGGMGSVPGLGTKIPHAVQSGQKKKKSEILPVGHKR